jgi:molybdopterin-containing oxidoreductase family membrane subunit
MIPDFALVRDRSTGWRRRVYGALSFGWRGTTRQWNRLESAMQIMAIAILPVAVSVHTIVSFDFSMANVPMWHSTIFGPYFVVGAIFSGIAALIVAMIVFRKAYGLEAYLKPVHFRYLGQLLLIMSLLWFYFTFAEYLTGYYGSQPEEMAVFLAKLTGPFWPFFWGMALTNFVVPLFCLVRLGRHTIGKVLTASVSVSVGMWLERFIIIVPTLSNPRLPFPEGHYWPTWVEWGEMTGSFALFALFYLLFTKLFPIISIWEIREGQEGIKEVGERLHSYLPDPAEAELAVAERTR